MDSVPVDVLVNCPRDGFVYQRDIFLLGPGADFRLTDTWVPCPEYGFMVLAVNAKYSADRRGRVSRAVQNGPTQKERIKILRETVEWARNALAEGVDEQIVATRLEDAAQTVAKPLYGALGKVRATFARDPAGWIALLLTVIVWWTAQSSSVSAADIEQIVTHSVEQILDGPDQRESEEPTQPDPETPSPEPPPTVTELPTPDTH